MHYWPHRLFGFVKRRGLLQMPRFPRPVNWRLQRDLRGRFAPLGFLAFPECRLRNTLEEIWLDDVARGDATGRAVCKELLGSFRQGAGAIPKGPSRESAVGDDTGGWVLAMGAA